MEPCLVTLPNTCVKSWMKLKRLGKGALRSLTSVNNAVFITKRKQTATSTNSFIAVNLHLHSHYAVGNRYCYAAQNA